MNCKELLNNVDGLEPKELLAWEGRFDEAERVMGTEAANALRKLYDYYGKDFLVWLAKLYDPDTGCFYYSNSARDNEGFLPDCESTAQTLSMFKTSGMLDRVGYDYAKAYPEKMVTRCREYLKSLQSPDDGYFYHPQWGKSIGSSRRGRDLTQCIEIIRKMGGQPLYPTAVERLSTAKTESGSKDKDLYAGLPDYMRSEEAMVEKLKTLDINGNSYSAGHWISSQTDQLIAAGLGDCICDYLDSIQDTNTGLWEEGATYNSVSGIIKIAAFYNRVPGRILKHTDKIIESCIDVVLSDEDTLHMCFVFNPHGALNAAITSLVNMNARFANRGEPEPYDIPALRRLIYSKFPAMVERTIEKLERFKLPDGSYSYFQAHCAAMTQGTTTALRCKEGDVNATICATLYIIGGVFGYLGIPVVPIANAADFEVILDIIDGAKPIKKIPKPVKYLVCEDFQNYGLTFRSSTAGECHCDVTYDPIRPNNKAFQWTVDAGVHSSYTFDGAELLNPPDMISCFEFESELLITETTEHGDAYTLTLEAADGREAYAAVIGVEGGVITLSDTSEYGNPACTDRISTLGKIGEWIKLTFLYYPGEHGAKIKVYHNGMCVKVSENYYGSFYKDREPVKYVNKGKFTKTCEEKSVIYFDNIKTQLYTDNLFIQ